MADRRTSFVAALTLLLSVPAGAYRSDPKTGALLLDSMAEFDKCATENYAVGACLDALKAYVEKKPKEAFDAGKRARLYAKHWAALPFFDKAFAKKPAPGQCADEDVRLAVYAGLALPADNPHQSLAAGILGNKCWSELKDPLLQTLKEEPSGYFADNLCAFLKGRGLAPQECDPKKPEPEAGPAPELLKLGSLDWKGLPLVADSAMLLRGEGAEEVYMVKTGPVDGIVQGVHVVKFKGFGGPWDGKVLLTVEMHRSSGRDHVALIDGKEKKLLETTTLWGGEGAHQAFPAGRPPVRLYRVPLEDQNKKKATADILQEFK